MARREDQRRTRGREESEMPEMEKARERSKKREKRIRERSGEGSLLVVPGETG